MTLTFKTTVLIDGNEIPVFKNLRLHQRIHSHHILKASFPQDIFEDSDYHQFIQKSFSIETITTNSQNETLGTLEFNGIITSVQVSRGSRMRGNVLIITASSKEIVANDGPHYNCFHECKLNDIVNQTFGDYGVDVTANASFSEVLDYTVQNHESTFDFVKRLAEKYGEWLYYNGKKLIFGKPENESVSLKQNHDLGEFEINYVPKPQKFKYFTHNYLDSSGSSFEYAETSKPAGLEGDHAKLYDTSNKVFQNETNVWVNANSESSINNIIKAKAKAQQASFALNQLKVSGQSWNSGVALGNIVEIEGQSYRITEVIHALDGKDDYQNNFEAVNANIDGYPLTNINAFSASKSQIATVKENADPDKLGRVKVSFVWQEFVGEMTPWIRVVSPHAGVSQGIQFIPEIGDQVLVDFEGGDIESPYVVGSLYHGGHKPADDWNTDKNDIKVIRTRSGHTIELDDTSGEEKIKIYDNEGSIITLDTKEKSLTIVATENIDISATNINIAAKENITIGAEGNIEIGSKRDSQLVAEGALKLQATGDASVKGQGKLALEAGTDATLKGLKAIVNGQASAELSAPQTKVSGSAMTEVSGGLLKLN